MKIPETETLLYRPRVRLEPEGPAYVMRFQGDRAVWNRRREDGTLEVIICPDTVSAHPVSDIDPDGIQLLPLPPARSPARTSGPPGARVVRWSGEWST